MGSGASQARVRGGRKRLFVLFAGCVAIAVYAFPIRLGVVSGESMAPAFSDGQLFLLRRLRGMPALRRGDVVVLTVAGQSHIKRIYAVAGDVVRGLDWEETDGCPDYVAEASEVDVLRELARRWSALGKLVEVKVPEGHVFVLGDAVTRSYDSRHFGPVPVAAVSGRVVASLLPLRKRTSDTCPVATALELEDRPQGPCPSR